MFIPNLALASTDATRYDYIQSAQSSDMEARFTQKIAELIAENVVRVAAQLLPLNISDIDIAGGGDGHTFVVRLLLTTAVAADPGPQWLSASFPFVRARFWMGADAEALSDYQEAAIASLFLGGLTDAVLCAAGMAGTSKGTRFMAFFAAAVQ
jgi:hypothetical protein